MMNDGSGASVIWILVPIFVAVGVYLIWDSRRRKKMLETFANMHRFRIRPDREGDLQKTPDSCFSLEGTDLIRSFGQLSSVIDGGPVLLFRTVELLDLNPHARSQSTHFSRIVALFDISADHDEFFVLDKSMQAGKRLPTSRSPNPDVAEISKRIVNSYNARHSLSVTLSHGHGLIYFEPLVTGGENLIDVDSLYCIAKDMREAFSGPQ